LTSSDSLIDIRDHLERGFDAILIGLACIEPLDVVFSRESKNVERVLTGERN
jgi:hypothetical protein